MPKRKYFGHSNGAIHGGRSKQQIADLEGSLKQRDDRIAELREGIDELRDLISRLRGAPPRANVECIQSWMRIQFEMVQTESGGWTWGPFWDEHNGLHRRYNDLVRRWNKYLPRINREPRNVGRPLAASEAQCAQVLKMHKGGIVARHRRRDQPRAATVARSSSRTR